MIKVYPTGEKEKTNLKVYPSGHVVRAVLRAFPNGGGGLTGIDLGCGVGRNSKFLLDRGFSVKAIDSIEENVQNAKTMLAEYVPTRCKIECADFDAICDEADYDLVLAWHFLYAYNKTKDTCKERLKKINGLMKSNGKIIFDLRSKEDSFYLNYEKDEEELVVNPYYPDTAKYTFQSQGEVADLMSECGFEIEYMERFCRNHEMDWKKIKGNSAWGNIDLELFESFWVICATKKSS